MSAIQGISSATSSVSASSSSAGASAAASVSSQTSVDALGGVMAQQASSLLSLSGQQQSPAEALGAFLIAMLLSKSNESKDKQDPLAMLANLAMLGAALQQGATNAATNLTMMSSVTTAYSGGGASAAGASINVQG